MHTRVEKYVIFAACPGVRFPLLPLLRLRDPPVRVEEYHLTLPSAPAFLSQQYAWGKKGYDSVVAKLKGLGDAEYTVKPEETYAEMWIGTHPSGPSRVVRDGSPGPLLKVRDGAKSLCIYEHVPRCPNPYPTGICSSGTEPR